MNMNQNVLTNRQRLRRLSLFIKEGRILRGEWVAIHDGRERACLLAALAPEVASTNAFFGIDRCPASLMPMWLASITPDLDDRVSKSWWPTFLRLYAKTLRRVHALIEKNRWTTADWQGQDYLSRASVLHLVVPYADAKATPAVLKAIDYCERAAWSRPNKTRPKKKTGLEHLEHERKSLLRSLNGLIGKHRVVRSLIKNDGPGAPEAAYDAIVNLGNRGSNLCSCAMTVARTWSNSHPRRYAPAWNAIAKEILSNLNKRCHELELSEDLEMELKR